MTKAEEAIMTRLVNPEDLSALRNQVLTEFMLNFVYFLSVYMNNTPIINTKDPKINSVFCRYFVPLRQSQPCVCL
jgi:hypothetical protein